MVPQIWFQPSELNCFSHVVTHITLTGGNQCPNIDNPCHKTQQCDDSVIGGFQCRCDPNDSSLADFRGACLDASIWRQVELNRLGFKAVHLAHEPMTYDNANEYCAGLGAVLPNYFLQYDAQRLKKNVLTDEMLVFDFELLF